MKNSCDKTFRLTTNLHANVRRYFTTTACTAQSGLTPVRSVECGLFA